MILASGSPRRCELMRQAGYKFEVVAPDVDEPRVTDAAGVWPTAWAEALAYLKAATVAQKFPQRVVIGADTVCVHRHGLVGKPTDRGDAGRILRYFFAGPGEVITGLAVLHPASGRRIITHDVTRLVMRAMSEKDIEAYLDSGAWQGKAGAYALQEGGDRFVESMTGSESNVVGLPMEKLAEVLHNFQMV
ncbi:MAG: septum formation protein Maf [Sedimentisphaerales bacterium]|nr:septum formation protein Maf [Sedimentisphaerales bacterium]